MFVPPEQRQPGASPWNRPPPRPAAPPRAEAVGLWLVALLLVSIVLAPMGGSTVLEALWSLLRQ